MNKNRIISFILSVIMVFTVVFPTGAFAEEIESQNVEAEVQETSAAASALPVADEPVVDETVADEPVADEAVADEPVVDEAVADEPVADEPVADEPVAEEPAENEPVVEAPAENAAEEEEVIVEDFPFVEGYVRVNNGTTVYATESGQEEMGTFSGDAIVYAVVSTRAADEAYSWLSITFNTAEALLKGYVQFKDVVVLSEEAIAQLSLGNALPTVSFAAKAAEEPEQQVMEEMAAEEEKEITLDCTEEAVMIGTVRAQVADEKTYTASAPAIVITKQPADVEGAEVGQKYSLHVVAEGEGLQYQWKLSINGGKSFGVTSASGNKTATLTISVASEAYEGRQYYCEITDAKGNKLDSAIATVHLKADPIVITKQPTDVENAEIGQKYNLHVEAKGEGLKYQWKLSTNGGVTFGNTSASGNKTATLTISVTSEAYEGRQYYCEITDAKGNKLDSAVATVHLKADPIVITKQPADVENAEIGQKYNLHVEAEGEGLKYQWKLSTNGGVTFGNTSASGNKTATLTINVASEAYEGRQYYCEITDANGNKVNSAVATVHLKADPIVITEQPADVENAEIGQRYSLHVEAEGEGLQYQWKLSINGGKSFGVTSASGNKTATLTISVASEAYEGRQYYCEITDAKGNKLDSTVATVHLKADPIVITKQPVDVEGAEIGQKYNLHVEAKGEGLQYQWKLSVNGGKTFGVTGASGNKTATLTINVMSEAYEGRQYYCEITDAKGNKLDSTVATVHLKADPIVITKQPTDVENAEVGQKYNLHVEAEGEGLKYQWKLSTNGGVTFGNTSASGNKTATLTINVASEAYEGRQYYCEITDANGNKVNSAVVTIHLALTDGKFIYELNESGDGMVVAKYLLNEASVVVPEKFNGITVTEIGVEAFMGKGNLVSVDLPDTITVIRARAFKNCTSLTNMH